MGYDRSEECPTEVVELVLTFEPVLGKEVAHEDAVVVMARHGKKGARNAHAKPVFACRTEVCQVLETCEAHTHTDGIDDAVHLLVEIGIFAHHQEKHDEFGQFLGDACAEEGETKCSYHCGVGFGEKTKHFKWRAEQHRHKDGADAKNDGPLELVEWFGLQEVCAVDMIDEKSGGKEAGEGD